MTIPRAKPLGPGAAIPARGHRLLTPPGHTARVTGNGNRHPLARLSSGRVLGAAAALLGAPAGAWYAWHVIRLLVIGAEVATVLAVIFTALYGQQPAQRTGLPPASLDNRASGAARTTALDGPETANDHPRAGRLI